MSLVALFDNARARLAAAAAPAAREPLGELVEPRRILGVARAARIVPRGDAWHLGVLLLADDDVLATGEIIRAREERPRGFTAESQRRRAALAGAAFRGGFAEGRAVHVGWRRLDLDAVARGAASTPLLVVDDVPHVRWSPTADPMPLAAYLDERVALLLDPPAGA